MSCGRIMRYFTIIGFSTERITFCIMVMSNKEIILSVVPRSLHIYLFLPYIVQGNHRCKVCPDTDQHPTKDKHCLKILWVSTRRRVHLRGVPTFYTLYLLSTSLLLLV